jgi:hypothetical protein
MPRDAETSLQIYLGNRNFKPLQPGQISYWQNYNKFAVSFFKAMYGDNAKAENNYGYDWFPKLDMVYDHLLQFDLMHQGRIKLSSFGELRDDGSTMAACWIYTGCYTEAGNISARRDNADPSGKGVHPNWGFAWPANRRILYNRASADPAGKPWSDRKSYVYWDGYRVKGRPFNIPRISQVDHKAYKCTLCSDRVAVEQGPACRRPAHPGDRVRHQG